MLLETALTELPVDPETPAEFKHALRDATRVGGFETLADLTSKTGLSRGTLSPAFSENQPMPSETTIAAVVQAMHGDVEEWLARSRRVAAGTPTEGDEPLVPTVPAAMVAGEPSKMPIEPAAGPSIGSDRADMDMKSPPEPNLPRFSNPDGQGARSRFVKGGIGAAIAMVVAVVAVVVWLSQRDNTSPGRTIVVQNEVAIGASDLIEDNSPSYLAARPIAKCANEPNCKLIGTDLHTGDTVRAVCQLQGALLTNADVESAGIKSNPNAAASSLWYGVTWSDDRRGYISEVYIAPSYRGGLGLPGC